MRRLLASSLFAATAALVVAAPAAAAAPPAPGPGPSAAGVSVQDCAATGGVPMADGQGRYWCVGGVYTGVRIG